MMEIFFFDDKNNSEIFKLVFLNEPQYLRCGILTLKEKVEHITKKFIKGNLQIFVNSKLLINKEIISFLKKKKFPIVFSHSGKIAIAIFDKKESVSEIEKLNNFPNKTELKNNCFIEYPWDLIYKNPKEIENDLKILQSLKKYKTLRKNVFVGKNVKIEQNVVMDSSSGPIIIDDDAIIMANSVIYGPAYIGKKTIIKALSKIYGGTTIGPFCKVGGEIEETIFQGYSNKQHEGFLGHSFVGEWVNIGAGTNNSDLKNNYSNVKMQIKEKNIDTGKLFMGAIIGDHTKIGINTMLNTGTFIGIGCNVLGGGYMPKYIPPFSWGVGENSKKYNLEKAVSTAKICMARRKLEMNKDYETLFRQAYNLS